MRKGEIAFSTFVSLVIAAVILILVLVWLLPSYSDIFSKTDKISESAGVTDDKILELKCKPLCEEAKDEISSGTLAADTDFCLDSECKEKYTDCVDGTDAPICGV